MYIYPFAPEPPSPPPAIPPLWVIRECQAGLPVSFSNFPLTIYLHDTVYMSVLLSQSVPPSPSHRRRHWHPTPVLLPGKSHGRRSLVGYIQSMRSRRVLHDWVTSLSLFTFMRWRRKWQPTPVFLPGESQGQGSLVGCRLRGHTASDMTVLRPMSESPSGKRDLHDNATRKGREIYCWLESGPPLQPTQWCKVREPWAPVSTHIYRVLYFKHKQWVVIASRLFTCLRSNFIGQTHFKIFARRGLSRRFTGHVLIGWSLVACWGQIITPPKGETET